MGGWLRAAVAVLVLGATAGPVGYAVHLERQQARQYDADRVQRMAAEVLARVEGSGEAVKQALARLNRANLPACSPQEQRLMRGIELGSGYIRALGRVQGNRLVCSPLAPDADAPDLGPAAPTGAGPIQLRPSVRFAGAPGADFLVVQQGDFAAVVTKQLPFDLTDGRPGEALATLGFGDAVFARRGELRPEWLALARATRDERVVVQGDHVLAIKRSPALSVVVIAAVPRSAGAADRAAARAVPFGILAGLALLLVAARVSRSMRELPTLLRTALRNGELHLAYQPVVDMASGRPVAIEALLRWPRTPGAGVTPDVFTRVAEENGLATLLTAYLLDQLRRELPTGFLAAHPPLALALNVAADDLYDPATLARIARLQAHLGGPLKVELTERSATRVEQARAVLDGLRAADVRVAIDDFGTGYSNLATLQQGRFDEIKIDKTFVEAIGSGAANSGVVDHVIAMARALRCEVVAEGVETQAQADYLQERGVRHAQGFLYARPMALRELEAWLAAKAVRRHAGEDAVGA